MMVCSRKPNKDINDQPSAEPCYGDSRLHCGPCLRCYVASKRMAMFSHIMLGTNNLSESIRFYDQVMPILGYSRESTGEAFAGYGSKEDISTGINCLWIGTPFNGEPATVGNGMMVAIEVGSPEEVDAVYKKAIELGGTCEGAPGGRGMEGFYAGYFRDLDGNKLNAFHFAMPSA